VIDNLGEAGLWQTSVASLAPTGFRPMLDTTFPLDEAAGAHRYLEDGQNVGRVWLLIPQPEGARPWT
jgi:NADPH:quinone reductase-like Zn-dependent oxidoreductase